MAQYKKLVFNRRRKIKIKYYHARSWYWQHKRLLFPSPAETKFIELMGGRIVTPSLFGRQLISKNGFPLCIILSIGRILKRENITREVRAGKCFIDFGSANRYYKKGIEIDGRDFHQDVIKELERDEYVKQFGWQLLHIQATELWRSPAIVQRKVIDFLSR